MLFFILDLISGLANTNVFKYISCYSLSCTVGIFHCSIYHLNTSHVILYQEEGAGEWVKNLNLNTSHVILYQFMRT